MASFLKALHLEFMTFRKEFIPQFLLIKGHHVCRNKVFWDHVLWRRGGGPALAHVTVWPLGGLCQVSFSRVDSSWNFATSSHPFVTLQRARRAILSGPVGLAFT